MNNTETMKQVYLLAQEHCGLKVGDWVKVTRKAERFEAGWDFDWNKTKDQYVGKIGRINDINMNGLAVNFVNGYSGGFYFPYFVLEKVEKPVHEFKPFDKVLVRDGIGDKWLPDIFGYKIGNCYYCISNYWNCCIPYEGNEHLVGRTDMPGE